MALSKRSRQNFSGNLDYTYSISEGNASDPTAAFYDEQSDIEPEKMLVPLDWDQRHTINGTATYPPIKSSGVSIIFSYGVASLTQQQIRRSRELHLRIMEENQLLIILIYADFSILLCPNLYN